MQLETVIQVDGKVLDRSNETINKDIDTGQIEVSIKNFIVLGTCKELPMPIFSDQEYAEEIRLKYRYLDLRRKKIHENIVLRSNVISHLRNEMNKLGFLEFQTPILMTLRNRKSVNSVCEKDCKNLFARSPYEFQILQQGDSYVFTSTLKKAIVLVRYYKYPMDENGLPLIPDNPIIQKALEFHLMHYFFYMAWLNSDDVNIERKIQDLEIKRNNFLVDAMNYTKMQSFQQAVQMARKVRKRFGAYEEINSKHI